MALKHSSQRVSSHDFEQPFLKISVDFKAWLVKSVVIQLTFLDTATAIIYYFCFCRINNNKFQIESRYPECVG